MSRLLTLSRAARLIGITRGALQGKIRSGELAAFEGMVSAHDLLRAFPEAKLEGGTGLERFERIKDTAFARRVREHVLPTPDVLMARLTEMSRELAQAQTRSENYRAALEQASAKLREVRDAAEPGEALDGLLAWLRRSVESAQETGEPPELLVQDEFMRIMTAQVQIRPSGHEFFVEGGDTLLEAALRAGLALDYGCSIGSCGRCKARVVSGQVRRTRHSDYALTAAEKNAGVVLMCCNSAVDDLVIEAHEAHGAADMPLQRIEAKVKSVRPVTEDMRLLHVQTPRTNRLRFLAGQSVTLALADGPAAPFAVASCPCDDRNLEFHVRRLPVRRRAEDAFAEHVFAGLKAGDTLRVEGPRGEFVLDEESNRRLIFIAWETGFAPVKSLIEHAMALEAAETIHLYWITSSASGRYFDNLCRAWNDALDNFRYLPLALEHSAPDEAAMRSVLERVLEDHARPEDCDFYVAGSKVLAQAAERLLSERAVPRSQVSVAANPNERSRLRAQP